MPSLNKQLLVRKTKLIEKDLSTLKKFSGVSKSTYTRSQEIQLQVERLIERIIGRLIDINYHILKEKYDTLPDDYYESFILMGKKKEVTISMAKSLAKSTGLRNILSHEYDEIDPSQVHKAIKSTLAQVPAYLKSIL